MVKDHRGDSECVGPVAELAHDLAGDLVVGEVRVADGGVEAVDDQELGSDPLGFLIGVGDLELSVAAEAVASVVAIGVVEIGEVSVETQVVRVVVCEPGEERGSLFFGFFVGAPGDGDLFGPADAGEFFAGSHGAGEGVYQDRFAGFRGRREDDEPVDGDDARVDPLGFGGGGNLRVMSQHIYK